MRAQGFAGFSQQLILKLEKGDRPLRLDEAVGVSRVFGISLDDLVKTLDGDVVPVVPPALADATKTADRLIHELQIAARNACDQIRVASLAAGLEPGANS